MRQLSAIRHFISFICPFISAITLKSTNPFVKWHDLWFHESFLLNALSCLLKTSIHGEFIEYIFTSQPSSSLFGSYTLHTFWTMIKTTWSWAPALQPQPRPIKRPHCGIGAEATGLRLWSLVEGWGWGRWSDRNERVWPWFQDWGMLERRIKRVAKGQV